MESGRQIPLSEQIPEAETSKISPHETTQRSITIDRSESSIMSFLSGLTNTLTLPFNFFQSRAEIRTWGEHNVADPSVQPQSKDAPTNFGTGLPGYSKHSCAYFDRFSSGVSRPVGFVSLFSFLNVKQDQMLGPTLDSFPRCKVQYPALPAQKLGDPSYDYWSVPGYHMDFNHPYVNAVMLPYKPEGMYVHANWMTGYPYGVPAVEENTIAAQVALAGGCCR